MKRRDFFKHTLPATVTIPALINGFSVKAYTGASPLVQALLGATETDKVLVLIQLNGGNDGLIIVNAAGGNSSYQYSMDGTTYQSSDSFLVAPGNYMITVRDNLNCVDTQSFIVGLTSNLTHTP